MTRSRIFNVLIIALFTLSNLLAFVPVTKAAGASLYLTPSTGTFVIGSTFKVGVKVNSGGEAINAAEGAISYDKDLLEVTSLAKGSVFMFWTTEPSSGGGVIRFGGGNPTSYTGTAGGILTISFKAKKAGTGQVRFTSGAVLANDGKGTNILASMGSGSYTISPKVEAPMTETNPTTKPDTDTKTPVKSPEEEKVTPVVETEYNKPLVKSATHPEQNTWYQSGDVKLSWELPKEVNGVSYTFDKLPTSDPGAVSNGLVSEKDFVGTEGGIWYFHIKFKDASKWGTTAHYKVMIDKNPPSTFSVKISSLEAGSWPVLEFDARDDESGLDRYELYIGSLEHQTHKLTVDKKSIELADLEPGSHTVLLKAIDKAGNQRLETVEFVIDPIATPVISDYAREVKPSDKFYLSGTAPLNSSLTLFLYQDDKLIASTSVKADANGKWSYLHTEKLPEGRYTVSAQAINEKGIRSEMSAKISFLVTPPVFAVIGSFILDYFTVIVSLIFISLLIVMAILFLIFFARKKLKKETVEVEDVLKRNLGSFRKELDEEFKTIIEKETRVAGRKDKSEIRNRLRVKLDMAEEKIMKEVKDVEEILK